MIPEAAPEVHEVPLWERLEFVHTILGNSLASVPPSVPSVPSSPQQKDDETSNMAALVSSLKLVLSQVNALSEASTAPLVRSAAAKTSAAFKRCLELCEHMPSVTDTESFYSMLAFVARIKAWSRDPSLWCRLAGAPG